MALRPGSGGGGRYLALQNERLKNVYMLAENPSLGDS